MIREKFHFRETFATILADDPGHVAAAKEGILAARQAIEAYIARDPFFAATYEPCKAATDDPVIQRMARAAMKAGVGPMAAVAGTIAWAGLEAMQDAGAAFGVIDNGGDIALIADRPVRVGVHAGRAALSNRIAFVVPPQEGILGICTSSATVGPSISFGVADAVCVFSRDVSLADAWATALCNTLLPGGEGALAVLEGTGVMGALAIIGEEVMAWGDLPPIAGASVDPSLITRGEP
jgi:ApbE superfamily uncharacterized protein (UPF0280 family)